MRNQGIDTHVLASVATEEFSPRRQWSPVREPSCSDWRVTLECLSSAGGVEISGPAVCPVDQKSSTLSQPPLYTQSQSIAVLGSTGSIGTSCLDVIRQHPDRLRAAGLVAHRSVERLCQQVAEFRPQWAVIGSEEIAVPPMASKGVAETNWHRGLECVAELIRRSEIDTVVSAMVGAAGLPATWAAVDAGKRVALANKESLVVAGSVIMERARQTGATIIPVDSEHSAIFQCLQTGRSQDLRRIVLTASGGPFRGFSTEQLKSVTPEMALKHPTWSMGPKISVDSATMMNKALEIIEARWLFGLPADKISVVIHPQSWIHSLVEFQDGSVISQNSPPDMRLPIQYALLFPDRPESPARKTDWSQPLTLELIPPDLDAFPALRLGFEVAAQGGTSGAVLNAANEVAVARFLNRELPFHQITCVVNDILNHHEFDAQPSLEQLLKVDRLAREEAARWKT
jgi:1-deoxy-D-xylulose-5-phosphate reductoisomerase